MKLEKVSDAILTEFHVRLKACQGWEVVCIRALGSVTSCHSYMLGSSIVCQSFNLFSAFVNRRLYSLNPVIFLYQ